MASLTQWTLVCTSSGRWWWTRKPGVLQSMGSQRVGQGWVTELNWMTDDVPPLFICLLAIVYFLLWFLSGFFSVFDFLWFEYSVVSIFCSLVHLGVDFFSVHFDVFWTFWICGLVSSSNFREFSVIITSNIYSVSIPSSIFPLHILLLSHSSCLPQSTVFGCSVP